MDGAGALDLSSKYSDNCSAGSPEPITVQPDCISSAPEPAQPHGRISPVPDTAQPHGRISPVPDTAQPHARISPLPFPPQPHDCISSAPETAPQHGHISPVSVTAQQHGHNAHKSTPPLRINESSRLQAHAPDHIAASPAGLQPDAYAYFAELFSYGAAAYYGCGPPAIACRSPAVRRLATTTPAALGATPAKPTLTPNQYIHNKRRRKDSTYSSSHSTAISCHNTDIEGDSARNNEPDSTQKLSKDEHVNNSVSNNPIMAQMVNNHNSPLSQITDRHNMQINSKDNDITNTNATNDRSVMQQMNIPLKQEQKHFCEPTIPTQQDTTSVAADLGYWDRRRKNNEAAKRSRDARRQKEDHIAVRAAFLETENLKLRTQVNMLKVETSQLRYELYKS